MTDARRWILAAATGPRVPPLGGLSCFTLDVGAEETVRLSGLLCADEMHRAARLQVPQHANRFMVARARLRQQIAGLLSVAPGEIRFLDGPHGKPRIAGKLAAAGLEFNLSHSGSFGLVGWSWSRAIGVDIEFWRPVRDQAALVRRYFSAAEIAAYEALEPRLRTQAFFSGWTRKEAYVKAVGRGLGLPLDSFDVSLGDWADARLLRAPVVQDDGRSWSLAAPQLEAGVSAAVVLEVDAFLILPDP